jgi:para-aminobenzoate synthetase/4-amino-4-deoxychorismate lyase
MRAAVEAPVDLMRRPLGWDLTPADVLRLVRTDAHPVALCGAWLSGVVIAAEPVAVRAAPGRLDDIFDDDVGVAEESPASQDETAAPVVAVGGGAVEGRAFGGGWIGYLGYSAGGEALPTAGRRALPAWWFGYYDHVLRRDRATGEWYFEALRTQERASALEGRWADLTRRAALPGASPARARPTDTLGAGGAQEYRFGAFRFIPGAAGHRAAVAKAVEYIRKGDIFQANITLRAEAEFAGDPIDAFCQGVTALDPPYAAFIGISPPGTAARAALASFSPELFLRRTGDTVTSKPIKGTARRTADDSQAQRAELEVSAKNQAENVMIVDLVRNDLSRVCVPGTVAVPFLLSPEPHPGVWHLVSTVTGTLRADAGDGDLIRAAFAPGSVTGAPKVRALEVIDELETAPREAYTGAIGYRSPVAGLELNVAIRTFEFAAGMAWLGAGGGIVADSDPAEEYAECLIKAAPLVEAVGARLAPDGPAVGPADDSRAGLPHPAAGVFTSLLVTDGVTRGLPAHLARLEASTRALYGKDLPASLPGDLARCLAARPSGRLRITVRPVGGPLQSTVEVIPLPPASSAVTVRPVTVPGGLGAHKYQDRRLPAELVRQAHLAPDEQLLLIDETGELLETDRASMFAVIDGVLLTPPADGRILPGTTRAAVLRAARDHGIRVGQKPLTLDDLTNATEVFVTNAVAGILPVTSIEPPGLGWVPGPVTAAFGLALTARPPDGPLPSSAEAKPTPRGRGGLARRSTAPADIRHRPFVILVDNYDSFTWNLAHLLDVAGAAVEVVRNDEVTAAEVTAAAPAGVLISPGPCAPDQAGISIATVTACAASGIPLLGICLGHQAIGAAFGADIIAAPSPVHGKAYPVSHDGQGLLAGLPNPFQAARYHSLAIDESTLPDEFLITARTDSITMAVRHRSRPIEGIQFHPESILTTHGAAIIGGFVTAAVRLQTGRATRA